MRNLLRSLLAIGLSAGLIACGGGGGGGSDTSAVAATTTDSTPTGDNVQSISVNGGPSGLSSRIANIAYTSVTVCVPNTTQCQVIDNVIVDTGSVGLRVLSSALGSLTLSSESRSTAGHSLAECVAFLDGSYMWGPVRLADVKMAGKTASSALIQVVADSSYGTSPSTCLNNSNPLATPEEINSIANLGGNGILGVGHFTEDCGSGCRDVVQNNFYYDCDSQTPTKSCTQTAVALASQVQNPVALFGSDNNGVVIQMPAVASSGAASVDGWMIFGINTRSNNALGSAAVLTVSSSGYLNTTYKNTNYSRSFIDSGSNALYIPDSSIPLCSWSDVFFCPSSTLNLSATIRGQNNTSKAASFSVANTDSLNGNYNAFGNLAGLYTGGFDWGMPFFYGRKVFTALETNAEGPYVAF